MGTTGIDAPLTGKGDQPRIWPLVASLIFQCLLFLLSVTPSINNAVRFGFMLLGPAVGLLAAVLWVFWLCRFPWKQRLAVTGLVFGCVLVSALTVHTSVNLALFLYGVPLTTLALLSATVASGARRPAFTRWLIALVVPVWAVFPLIRIDGYDGQYLPEISLRNSVTPEQQLLRSELPVSTAIVNVWQPTSIEWPEFRGSDRNGKAPSSFTHQDWQDSPPECIWRRPIGPGWSSCILVSGRLFTQEQRGDSELVTCYDAATGGQIWGHRDGQRFEDVVSGAGPRATPTYADGRVYSYGSRALLNCLDAADGTLIWQRDLMQEVNAKLPVWGFASSPLIIDGQVVVYADGDNDHGLVAFDMQDGTTTWTCASTGMNFSSAQAMELDGVFQVVFGDRDGLRGIDPHDGHELWACRPANWRGPNVCQPQAVSGDSFVVPTGDGTGMVRLKLTADENTWQTSEVWNNNRMKPSFNDFVLYENHLYGFDQSILVCIDAETGKRLWKGGRYGFGQLLLLESAGQLVVVTETGELVLLEATPEAHTELSRVSGIEGKTWNHPIAVDGRLFVRSGEEIAAFHLHPN